MPRGKASLFDSLSQNKHPTDVNMFVDGHVKLAGLLFPPVCLDKLQLTNASHTFLICSGGSKN